MIENVDAFSIVWIWLYFFTTLCIYD